jgi:D-amino peptidase
MRVFISVDMEGVAGLFHPDQTDPSGREWDAARRLMTLECNAAIEGALEAGVQELVVADSHWTMRNLLPEELHPAAELVAGYPRLLSMLSGIGPGFDAAFFIGYHAGAGSRDGSMAHSYADPSLLREIRINGAPQTEGSLNAALCGYFDCPVVLFSGDATAVAQMHEYIPELEGVVVKEGVGGHAARSLHPTAARDRIRTGARRAVERGDSIPPFRQEGRLELELDFVQPVAADACELVPGVRRPGPTTVSWAGTDYGELYRVMLALILLGEVGAR